MTGRKRKRLYSTKTIANCPYGLDVAVDSISKFRFKARRPQQNRCNFDDPPPCGTVINHRFLSNKNSTPESDLLIRRYRMEIGRKFEWRFLDFN